MQITPETKLLSELLPIQTATSYQIPIYQRGYSWRTTQIDQLFEDIKNEELGYYIGNLLVSGDAKFLSDIVDGQQRLVTLSMFLLAIFEHLEKFKGTNDGRAHACQADIKRQLTFSGQPRIKLLDRDAEIFEGYLKILENEAPKKWGNRTFSKRYKYIHSLISEDNFTTLDDLINFYDKVNSVEILRITVPDLSDAFSVFSSLNSKGLPLTLIDLLKNEYLQNALRDGVEKDNAVEKWDTLIGVFTKADSDSDLRAVTQFLLNNFDAFESNKEASITKGRALSEYSSLLNEKGSAYIDTLISRAKVFSQIISISDQTSFTEETSRKLWQLDRLESSQAYPLLLFLLTQPEKLDIIDSLPRYLDFLIKFFVRRNIVLKPKASNIRSKMISIVRQIKQNNFLGDEIFDYMEKALVSISSSDDEFSLALDETLYDKNYATTRHLLISLERKYGHLFNKSNPDTLDDYLEKTKGSKHVLRWTVEHILPEGNLPDYWKKMLSPNSLDEAEEIQDEHVHKLGNLTLTPYNPELSQRAFVDKRDYTDNGSYVGLKMDLFLNSSIPDIENGETIQSKQSWISDDIVRRNTLFKNLILKEYSF